MASVEWWSDPEFNAYLDRFEERRGNNTQRRWMLWQLARLTDRVEGHTAECGVFMERVPTCCGLQSKTKVGQLKALCFRFFRGAKHAHFSRR